MLCTKILDGIKEFLEDLRNSLKIWPFEIERCEVIVKGI